MALNRFRVVMDQDTKRILLTGVLDQGLYKVSSPSSPLQANLASVHDFSLWHQRLGHPSDRVISSVFNVCNVPKHTVLHSQFCKDCQLAKSHTLPFSLSMSRASAPFELIHPDLWGPAPEKSITGARFFILFIDYFSRFSWLYHLHSKDSKDEAFPTFLKFQAMVERQFDAKIKRVQSDWGGEFRPLNKLFSSLGILHQLLCPHTPQQNGRVERKKWSCCGGWSLSFIPLLYTTHLLALCILYCYLPY